MSEDPRRFAPAASRNRDPILAELRRHLPVQGLLLEVASGSGEHCAHIAPAFPTLTLQPSDPEPDARASIDAWCAGLPNVRPAVALDAVSAWPISQADAVLCINMIHIAPWDATLGLLRGAARILPPGAPLILYGPFRQPGVPTAPGNETFDSDLRARNPLWGLRDLGVVAAAAAPAGFADGGATAMPANNLLVVFRRR